MKVAKSFLDPIYYGGWGQKPRPLKPYDTSITIKFSTADKGGNSNHRFKFEEFVFLFLEIRTGKNVQETEYVLFCLF